MERSEDNDVIIKIEMVKWCRAIFGHRPEDGYR
jgi:hypothetical protein